MLLIGLAGSFSPGARSSTFGPHSSVLNSHLTLTQWFGTTLTIGSISLKEGDYIGVFATGIRAVGTNKINGDWMPFPTP